MERLFVIILITISIVNFAQKQKRKQNKSQGQGGMKKQTGMKRQNPMQQWMNNPRQPDRTVRDMENPWGEGMKGEAEYAPASMPAYDNEGIEIEDRRRAGSLDYAEQSQSSEGMSCQPIKPEQKKKAVPKVEIIEEKESTFDLTEENLLRSIVMAEVLGPPRAMKRSIR